MLGKLLCLFGWHARRTVYWKERIPVEYVDRHTEVMEFPLCAWRCARCEPTPSDVDSPPMRVPRY